MIRPFRLIVKMKKKLRIYKWLEKVNLANNKLNETNKKKTAKINIIIDYHRPLLRKFLNRKLLKKKKKKM